MVNKTITLSLFALLIAAFIYLTVSKKDIVARAGKPDFHWEYSVPESLGVSTIVLEELTRDLEEMGTKKLLIIKDDHICWEWFAEGWEDSSRIHFSASLAKALVGGISLAVALDEEYIYPDMPACDVIPEWRTDQVKSTITIRQLATHTSGLDDAEENSDIQQQMKRKGLHPHMDLPGWKGQFWRNDPDPFTVSRDSTTVLFTPGSHFNYSNPGIAMLTYAVTASLKNTNCPDIRSLLWERIYNPLGIRKEEISIGYGKEYIVNDYHLVPSWGGGGFTANAVARIGRLMLRKGNWEGVALIGSHSTEKVLKYENTALPGNKDELVAKESSMRTDRNHYPATTMGWYSNFDGVWEHVPRDAFAGAGAGHQILLVVPSLNLIVVRMGNELPRKTKGDGFWTAAEINLFNPIMDAIIEAPYPQSHDIGSCEFAPKDDIIRLAQGSDNWPITWADDDHLYTAYGDGWGFAPGSDIKLSLGLARIEGSPPDITAYNISATNGERVGQGKNGPKASGLLSIEGVLYMLARNTGNAQLAWSADQGSTWSWADWKFDISFGCPTFLNFGKNYTQARDNYIYLYSHDEYSAYKISDSMMLARVEKGKLQEWQSYEYFAGLNRKQKPVWTDDIRKRRAVFVNPGKCYRSGISYNSGLNKYIWCQIIPEAGDDKEPRFSGGLGIFEADEPWGPWETVFYQRHWDVGPGETASIPTKWMSADGRLCNLVFSGDDCFSVRKLKFNTSVK